MNTDLKNQWIALEEEYQTLLKEKVNMHNLNNSLKQIHPSILSQMIFCRDGVVIKKLISGNENKGISVMIVDQSIAELKKFVKKDKEIGYSEHNLSINKYRNEEIICYNLNEAVKMDFEEILKNKA